MTDDPRIEDLLLADLQAACPADWTREVQPFEGRKWRIDVCSPSHRLAIEVNGSFHVSHGQMRKDNEKANALTAAGWRCLSYPASSVKTHKRRKRIVEQIARVFCGAIDSESDFNVLTGE